MTKGDDHHQDKQPIEEIQGSILWFSLCVVYLVLLVVMLFSPIALYNKG